MLSGLRGGAASPNDLRVRRQERSLTSGLKNGLFSSGNLYPKKKQQQGLDPFFSNVVLLSHFNGTDGSTSFVDVLGNTFTATGSPIISTAQSQWGGASLYLNGGSYLTVNSSGTLSDLSTVDFTLECWVRFNNLSGFQIILNKWPASGGVPSGCYQLGTNGSRIEFYWSSFSTGAALLAPSTSLSINTWSYIAVARVSNTFNIYINSNTAADTSTASPATSNTTNLFDIGAQSGALKMNGYVDDVRITKGVARTIVVPTAQFPDS